jgi:O-antigen/teichoic acid export membrane protein
MLKNGFYNIVGASIRILLALLTIPGLIHLIGMKEYGIWTLISSTINLVTLAEAGLSISTTFFVSSDLTNYDHDGIAQTLTATMGTMLLLSTLAGICLWQGAPFLMHFFPALETSQQIAAVEALQIGGIIVWGRLIQQVLVGIEQAYQQYGLMNALNIVQSVLTNLGILAVAWFGGKTVAMMQLMALATVILLIAHVGACGWLLRDVRLRFIWSTEKSSAIIRYSINTWFTSLGGALFGQVDKLIVGTLLGVEKLGVYAAITSVANQINVVSALPVQPLLPILSKYPKREKDKEKNIAMLQGIKQALQLNAVVALGMGVCLFALSSLVMGIIIPSTTSNSEYTSLFQIAVMIYTLYSLNAFGYYTLLGINAVKLCMFIQLTAGLLSLLLICFGAQYFDLSGAVLGNGGYIGTYLLTLFGMHKLCIPSKAWGAWIQFPVLWFIASIIMHIAVPNIIILKAFILALQVSIMALWFITAQGKNIRVFNWSIAGR